MNRKSRLRETMRKLEIGDSFLVNESEVKRNAIYLSASYLRISVTCHVEGHMLRVRRIDPRLPRDQFETPVTLYTIEKTKGERKEVTPKKESTKERIRPPQESKEENPPLSPQLRLVGEEGSKPKPKHLSMRKAESFQEISDFCDRKGIPVEDAKYCWTHWEANGWSNGGKPIKDWKMTILSWKHGGYLPSQKQQVSRR